MYLNFEREAAQQAQDCAPVSAIAKASWDSPAVAHEAIAAIWQTEADRLIRLSWSIVRKVNGADPENIVADALTTLLEQWEMVKDASKVRALLYTAVRNLSLDAIRTGKPTIEADSAMLKADSSDNTPLTDTVLAWLMDQCDETECRILTIWLLPGNQSNEAIVTATEHWKDRWTIDRCKKLFKRLRLRIGVQLPSASSLRFTTKGTLPGLHCEAHSALWASVMLLGAIPHDAVSRTHGRRMIPALRQDRTGRYCEYQEEVPSIPIG